MPALTNTDSISEIKTFLKSCIEEESFCDVTLSFRDGFRKCNSIIFLLTGEFWKDMMKSLDGNSFSCVILPDLDASSFDTMIKLLLDGFVTIQSQEKESIKCDIRTYFPNIPSETIFKTKTKTIFDVEDSPLVCKICLKRFSTKEARLLHEKTHTCPKRYNCKKCSKTFHTLHAKNVHEKRHDLINFHYVCPTCGKCYKNHQDLMKHCKSKVHDHPDEGVYPEFELITKGACKLCNICNRWVKRLAYHKRTHHSEQSRKFVCDICEFETDRKDSLATHQYLKHKVTNRKFSKLDETFKNEQPQYKCFECKKVFDTFSKIENHMLLRSCEEFQCKICNKIFKQKKNLNQHTRNVHENTDKFECKQCKKKYAHKTSLDKHLKKCK